MTTNTTRWVCALAASCLVAHATRAQAEENKAKAVDGINLVTSPHGSVKVGFVLQVGMDWIERPQAADTFEIKPTRARLLLSGFVIDRKIEYFLQFDGVQGLQSILPDSAGEKRIASTKAEPASPGVPFLLDMTLLFKFIPKTTIKVGRYLSQFMYMMPRNTADLYMISYPLVLYKLGVWRQFSIESMTETRYLDVIVGLYNGPPNNWGDDNKYKDYNLKIRVKPAPWIHVGAFVWVGMPRATAEASTKLYAVDVTYGGEIYIHFWEDRVKLLAEGLARSRLDHLSRWRDSGTAYGLYVHGSVQLTRQFELLGRFDFFDPSSSVRSDMGYWVTGGVNWLVDGIHAKLSVNYIYKLEETRSFVGWSEVLAQASLHF